MPALVPLLRIDFFESHDGLFHVYRLVALDRAVRAGVLYPRWFPSFGFGYGQPVFNFYGPLSYYWGLPFTLLGADAVLAMKLVFSTGLIASVLTMYFFARLHVDRVPALVAAVVYAYLPYHLLDLYMRGAVAEFLAFVWFPAVLWGFHQLILKRGRHDFERAALAALMTIALVITHSLSAFIFAPVLGGYILILLLQTLSRRAVGRVALASVLVVVVSAFYWLPVLTESRYVGLGHGTSQGYQDHLLSMDELVSWSPAYDYSLEPGVPITFPLGWIQVAILLAALALPFRAGEQRAVVVLFLAVAFLSAFMLTIYSLPAWLAFEKGLAFLQYPWRFKSLTAVAAAFLTGVLLQRFVPPSRMARAVLGGLLILGTGVWALWDMPITPSTPDLSTQGMWRRDRELGQVGATWTGEYVPVWVEEERWAISYSPSEVSVAKDPSVSYPDFPGERMWLTGVGYTSYELVLEASQAATLVLHQFYYPGWQAEWQGEILPARPEGRLGLAAFDLPPGSGPLTVRLGLTPSQRWGTVASLLAALVTFVALFARFGNRGLKSVLYSLLPSVCSLLLAAILLGSLILPNGHVQPTKTISANLEDAVELLTFTAGRTSYYPGDTVEVTLYWLTLSTLGQDYKTFIHLTDADVTRQPTQHDDDPGGDFTPTTRWVPGELVPDTHYLTLPEDLSPGRYHIWADMYEFQTVRNLTVLSAEAPTDGDRVLLTEIEVLAP
jgi:hypothetical protein